MATRNRYAEIMAQYAQSQPFSFTGIPSSYYGGQAGYTGGYDVTPYTPYVAPVNRYADIMAQPFVGSAGGGYGASAEGQAERNAGFERMALDPDAMARHLATNEAIGGFIDKAAYALAPGAILGSLFSPAEASDNSTGGPSRMPSPAAVNAERAMQAAITAANAEGAGLAANPMSRDPSQGGGRSGGGGYSGAPSAGSDVGRSAPGSAHYAKGGYVSMQHLGGPDPEGPDDGYAALKDGEFVINDKAVKKYGIELMQAINSGKIPKGKLRGLLEM